MDTLETREKNIKEALLSAENARKEAEKVSSDYQESIRKAQVESQKIISASKETANKIKKGIEKDASINEEIDKLRLKTTSSLMSRQDVIVISSVSCIYGIGSPDEYSKGSVKVSTGDTLDRRKFLSELINIHYVRNDKVLERGNVRVRGDVLEIFPAYEDACIRLELFGSDVDTITRFDSLTGEIRYSSGEPIP